ncbi:SH3 domain-containing protein [Stappia indica]|nr:SH3 domain-containing protein [Stappia indica]
MRVRYFGRVVVAFLSYLAIQPGFGALAQSYSATATRTLNLRAGPGTSYDVIGAIPAGGTVTVFGCTNGYRWCDINYSGQRGWASGKYLAYAGGGAYYGYPLYSSGIYVGLPIFWDDYPVYGPGRPGNRPPGAVSPRPPRPAHPIARPPGDLPPGVRPPRPSHPIVRPPRPSHSTARPPSYRPRPGVGAGGRPGGGYRGGGGGRGGFGGGGRAGGRGR